MDALGTDVTGFELVDLDDNESRNYDRILRDVENMLNRSESKELVFPGAYFRKEGNDIVVQEVCTLHGSSDSHFHFEEESSGTFEALKLLPILFMKGSDMTLIFDEYGSNMHTLMAYRFIQLFQKENEGLNNQLLVATHHTSLMSFDLFRRDEIWFVDKRCGESELYSLEEFDVRLDGKRLDKAYLEGRFGALPVFKDVS
jgi:AAA15 family ATPase/GTPase